MCTFARLYSLAGCESVDLSLIFSLIFYRFLTYCRLLFFCFSVLNTISSFAPIIFWTDPSLGHHQVFFCTLTSSSHTNRSLCQTVPPATPSFLGNHEFFYPSGFRIYFLLNILWTPRFHKVSHPPC